MLSNFNGCLHYLSVLRTSIRQSEKRDLNPFSYLRDVEMLLAYSSKVGYWAKAPS
jgi:hypothetical protein